MNNFNVFDGIKEEVTTELVYCAMSIYTYLNKMSMYNEGNAISVRTSHFITIPVK